MGKTLKRGSWRGLIQKEWVFLKWTVIALVLINIVITVLEISPIIAGLLNINMTETLTSSNTWFFLHMYMGVVLLLTSLVNEMNRPDIWLHSPVSIMQLVGSKIVFAVLAVACSFLLCGIVIGVSSYIGGVDSNLSDILSYVSTIAVLIMNTVFMMIALFFVWSVYQTLRSRIGRMSIIVTAIIMVISTILWAFVWFTDWFQMFIERGPILNLSTMTSGLPYLQETNFIFAGLMPDSALLTVGSLLLYIVFSLGFFIGGAILFEKKVRL